MNVIQFSNASSVARIGTNFNLSLVVSSHLKLAAPFQSKTKAIYSGCYVECHKVSCGPALRILYLLLLGNLQDGKPIFLYAPVENKVVNFVMGRRYFVC